MMHRGFMILAACAFLTLLPACIIRVPQPSPIPQMPYGPGGPSGMPGYPGPNGMPGYPGPSGMPHNPIAAAATAQTQARMHMAEQTAVVYFAQNETYETFTPDVAAQMEPNITWNASPTSVEGEVSIREMTPVTVLLTTKAADGTVWCVADDRAQDVTVHALTEAQTLDQCTGEGWPEF